MFTLKLGERCSVAVCYSVLWHDSICVLEGYSSATKLVVPTITLRASFGVCLVALSQLPV